MHTTAATSAAVAPTSTTCGTVSKETPTPITATAPNQPNEALPSTGKLATNNKAQAAIIQLNNKGNTEVEGGLVKGLSHGKAQHKHNNTFLNKGEFNTARMVIFFVGRVCLCAPHNWLVF
jgi:hypothetical protein